MLINGREFSQEELEFLMKYGSQEMKDEILKAIGSSQSGTNFLDQDPMDMMKQLAEGNDGWLEKYIDTLVNQQNIQSARDYETEMSNTAIQRSVSDMQAAGLNPWVFAGGGVQASTPATSAAQVGDTSPAALKLQRENMIMSFIGGLIGAGISSASGLGSAGIIRSGMMRRR